MIGAHSDTTVIMKYDIAQMLTSGMCKGYQGTC